MSVTVESLIDHLVEDLTTRFRIDSEQAQLLVAELLSKHESLIRQAEREESLDRIKRTRVYKDFRTRLRKRAYDVLRKYKTDAKAMTEAIEKLKSADRTNRQNFIQALLQLHLSTRERQSEIEAFHRLLFSVIPSPRTVLDVGCGIHPLSFSFETAGTSVRYYLAADRDSLSIEAVNAYAKHLHKVKLSGICWEIDQGWERLLGQSETTRFDVCLMQKLVPVIARQQRHLLPILADAPAKYLVITGSTQSMTKFKSIERREMALLNRFAGLAGGTILKQFSTGNEVGLMIDRTKPGKMKGE